MLIINSSWPLKSTPKKNSQRKSSVHVGDGVHFWLRLIYQWDLLTFITSLQKREEICTPWDQYLLQMSYSHKSLVNWNKLKLHFPISSDFEADSVPCEVQMKPVVVHSLSCDVKGTECQALVEICLVEQSALLREFSPLYSSKAHFPCC